MKRCWLRDIRVRAKLTQAELAREIGKPQSFISKIERGENPDPSISEVLALAAALDVDPMSIKFGKREAA